MNFRETNKCTHQYPAYIQLETKVYDYRMQKIKYSRYVCNCGKYFSEKASFVNKYKRYSKEWNQVVKILSVITKTFEEAVKVLDTWKTTVIRCFNEVDKNN